MTQTIYNKIYLLGKSLKMDVPLELNPSELMPSGRADRFTAAMQWAMENGLVKISPKTNKLSIQPHNLVSSVALQRELGMDKRRFSELVRDAGITPEFRDPNNIQYFLASQAKALTRLNLKV